MYQLFALLSLLPVHGPEDIFKACRTRARTSRSLILLVTRWGDIARQKSRSCTLITRSGATAAGGMVVGAAATLFVVTGCWFATGGERGLCGVMTRDVAYVAGEEDVVCGYAGGGERDAFEVASVGDWSGVASELVFSRQFPMMLFR